MDDIIQGLSKRNDFLHRSLKQKTEDYQGQVSTLQSGLATTEDQLRDLDASSRMQLQALKDSNQSLESHIKQKDMELNHCKEKLIKLTIELDQQAGLLGQLKSELSRQVQEKQDSASQSMNRTHLAAQKRFFLVTVCHYRGTYV